ncbi:MAG: carboxypeptidase regulatory-like domain-containing protein [Bacteroidetes bacterium]|nr:carboxypeptidase regulatory-like domain-containing protein [Bacteroidota bacterium]
MHINFNKSWNTGWLIIMVAVLLAAMPSKTGFSQVSVTTVITPPFDKPLDELANQTVLTLVAVDYMGNIYLTMKIEGDNGIMIKTPEGMQTEYFALESSVPLTLTGSDLDDVFSTGKLSFTGITATEAYSTGLPAGNYSICFRAWSAFGDPVSPETGGCTSFTILPPPVNITLSTQVTPPYPWFLDELADKTMVTLFSTGNQQVMLSMHLSGNNGVDIRTKQGFNPGEYIDLTANVPHIATGMDLYPYFQAGALVFSGISGKEVINRGLPEGRYKLCFRAMDTDGEELTPPEPSGCSQTFEIRDLDPPSIIGPVCGSTIPYADVPTFLFNWTPSPGAPAWTEYTLKIAEMPDPDMNPAEAMAGATDPAFFEETVQSTSFFYGPGQPILEKGQHYAFMIIASDPESATRFKNSGQSEVCSFRFGKEGIAFIDPGLNIAGNLYLVSPNVFPGLLFAPASISGKIKYFHHNIIDLQGNPLKNTNLTFTVQYILEDINQNKKILLTSGDISQSNIPQEYLTIEPGRVLSTTLTDDQGRFETVFLLPDSLGLVTRDLNVKIGYGDVGARTYFGSLIRVIRVIVENPYMLSPEKDLIVEPNGSLDNVSLVTFARDYGINVTIDPVVTGPGMEQFFQNMGENLAGINVFLYRSNFQSNGKPETEGIPDMNLEAPSFPFKKLVAAGITDENGKCNFKALLKAKGLNPGSYYLYAESDKNSSMYFESFLVVTGVKQILQENNMFYTGDYQVFSGGYEYEEYSTTLSLMPKPPRVFGNVLKGGQSLQPLDGAKVELLNLALLFPIVEQEKITANGGKYMFKDIVVAADGSGNLKPMPRVVKASKQGYEEDKETVLDGATLKMGQQAKMRDLVLQLPGIVKGKITDEQGGGISAYVYFVNGEGVQANPMAINMQTNQWFPAGFTLRSPLGYQQLVVEGGDAYFSESYGIQVMKGEQTMQPDPIVLKKKQHRVEVLVREGPQPVPGMFFNAAAHPVIPEATVRIKNRTTDKQTDNQGKARFEFGGNPQNDQFTIEVEGPEGKYYQDLSYPVFNAQFSKNYNNITVYLTKASFVSGYVRFEGQPVESATVRLDQQGGKVISAKTDAQGFYKLTNIPIGNGFRFIASKPGYISQAVDNVEVPASGKTGLDFELGSDQTMDLTSLLGFEVEVDTLIKAGTGAKISGRIVNIPGNNHFSLSGTDNSVAFFDLSVSPHPSQTGPSGKPLMKPSGLPFALTGKREILVNNTFPAITRTLRLTDPGQNGKGMITAKVVLLHGDCFLDNAVSFTQDSVYLADGSGKALNINVFSADGSSFSGTDIPLCNRKSADIGLQLYGFDVTGMKTQSVIRNQEAYFKGVLHTDLQNTIPADLKIFLGEVKIDKLKVHPAYGNTSRTFDLEKWKLTADNWGLNQSGLYFGSGTIKTHMVSIPFTILKVIPGQSGQKDKLTGGNFQLDEISLENITNVTLSGNKSFYYDNLTKHWRFVASPLQGETTCGYIPSLLYMDPNDRININSIILASDGSGNINLAGNTVTLSGITTFKPANILISPNKLSFSGSLDVNIPKIPLQSITLNYTRANNLVSMNHTTFNLAFLTNGVQLNLNSGSNAFSQDGFIATGTLSEPQKYSMNVKLLHKKAKTEILMTDNEFNIDAAGKRKLTNTQGEMHVINNQWSNFLFSGDLTGTNGMNGRLELEIIGDIVASGQSVQLNNISTPFGNLTLTYDFPNKRFYGNLTVDNKLGESSDKIVSEGLAEVLIDGDGWYFVAGGHLDVSESPLIKGAKMAMLFGSYPNIHATPAISNVFNTYSFHQKVPDPIQNGIEGFYTDGRITFGLPIPDIDVNMIVAHGKLKIRVYAGMNMGMNFSGPANHYHFGSNLTCEANAEAGVSALFGCVAGSLGLKSTFSIDGDYYSNGDWSLTGNWTNHMTGKIKVGGGVCCKSDCSSCKCCCGVCSCSAHSESASADFNLKVTIDRSGFEVCADTPLGDACY